MSRRRAIQFSLAAFAVVLILGAGSATSAFAGGAEPAGVHVRVSRLDESLVVLLSTHRVVPRVQRSVGFTGYATYSFAAPRGRHIVSASARIRGAQANAVKIRRATVSRGGRRYTVSLIFPGEQGNPGRLVVRLGTVA